MEKDAGRAVMKAPATKAKALFKVVMPLEIFVKKFWQSLEE